MIKKEKNHDMSKCMERSQSIPENIFTAFNANNLQSNKFQINYLYFHFIKLEKKKKLYRKLIPNQIARGNHNMKKLIKLKAYRKVNETKSNFSILYCFRAVLCLQ